LPIRWTPAPRRDHRVQSRFGHETDKSGLRAFEFACEDNGGGCEDPEILRTVGSSTSDLQSRDARAFGQGLIDVVAACEWAEIRTLRYRLRFDSGAVTYRLSASIRSGA